MGREFELKFRAEPQKIEEIQRKFGAFSSIAMQTLYYDTPLLALRARRWTLRRRLENGVSVCTLKTLLADGSRGEWEVNADTIEESIPMLCKLDTPRDLAQLVKDGLVQTCGARFTRLAKSVVLAEGVVELALDQGVLLGGGREEALCEVEVELKKGSETAAVAFAQAIVREFGLEPEPKSKLQRALELVR